MEKKLKVISLFSGYGTQELALKYAGINYENVANCDILKSANECYNTLHETLLGNLGDISKINENTFPDCDLLTYSYPCQDVSIAGKQAGIKEGTRSGLLFEVERIVGNKKPKYLLMENVKNLVSKKHIDSFTTHINYLKSLGYGCAWRVLNGADYGCPQNRERVFMMSVLGVETEDVERMMDKVVKNKTNRVIMKDFIEDEVSNNLFIDCDITSNTPKKNTICKMVGRRTDVKYDQASRIYSTEGCSPCLTTSGVPQIMLEDGRVRYISAREGYRFMGVKENDIDRLLSVGLANNTHIALAGNSICVPVMENIFKVFFCDYENEKKIKLYYDYMTPDSFFGDVEYVIEQREGNDFKYNITGIYETCDEDDEDCIWIHYENVK